MTPRIRSRLLTTMATAALATIALASCSAGSGSTGSYGSTGPYGSTGSYGSTSSDATTVRQTVSPGSSGSGTRPSSRVPAALIGRWNGGSNHTGHWYYEFYPDASYQAWPADDSSTVVLAGTFAVSGTTITFSNGGQPISSEWSVSDGLLYLDGFSYVRA